MINNADPFDGVVSFLRVAETLSFRRSAETLGVTPAAISRTIKRLEQRLGARLLERTTRSVRLTPEGAAFAARCRDAHAQVRLAERELSIARGVTQGRLVVSSSQILAPLFVPVLSAFLVRHPAIHVELRLSDRIARLVDEEVDVALRVGAVEDDELVAHPILKPRWITIASPAYLAKHGMPRTPDELARHACLRFVTPRGKPRPWTFADRPAMNIRGPLDVDRGDMLVTAALADVGIAQVLDFMVRRELREGRLIEVLADASAGGVTVNAVHLASRRSVPRVRAFVQFVRDELR